MLVKEPVVESPKHQVKDAEYEQECREALRPHLEALLELAGKFGWDRKVASFSLMYLAAKTLKADDHAAS
jgi:hypothetical protein